MSFVLEYISGLWETGSSKNDQADFNQWQGYLEKEGDNRKRDRILLWKDRVTHDDYAVNSEEPEFYRRTAGFVWRFKDETGYLYNMKVYGHRVFTRREDSDLQAAHGNVANRAATGDLGPLSPLDPPSPVA
eukprot:gene3355-13385_t